MRPQVREDERVDERAVIVENPEIESARQVLNDKTASPEEREAAADKLKERGPGLQSKDGLAANRSIHNEETKKGPSMLGNAANSAGLGRLARNLGVNTDGRVTYTRVLEQDNLEVKDVGELAESIEKAEKVASEPAGKNRISENQADQINRFKSMRGEVEGSSTSAQQAAYSGELNQVSNALGEITSTTGGRARDRQLDDAASQLLGQDIKGGDGATSVSSKFREQIETAATEISDAQAGQAEFTVKEADEIREAGARLDKISEKLAKAAKEKGVDQDKVMETAGQKALAGEEIDVGRIINEETGDKDRDKTEKTVNKSY